MSTKEETKPARTQPESLRARSMSLSLTVKDLQRSMAWYEMAGFHRERTWDREGKLVGAVYVAGEARFNLNQDDGKKGKDRTLGQGFSIHLTTGQEIDQVASEIKQRGGKLNDEPADRPWGVRSFYMTDPDGYMIGIQKPLETK